MVLVSTTDYEIPPGNFTIDRKKDPGISKAFLPEFLFKPVYGFPRKEDIITIRKLAATPYVHMIVRTLAQQVGTTPWLIRVKEEFQEDGVDHQEEIQEIIKFFKNPNDNDDSWEDIMVAWATDILELDSGVGVKVFNKAGNLAQIVARDGGLFLKNPDIHGMMSSRVDIIPPLNIDLTFGTPQEENPFLLGFTDTSREKQLLNFFDDNLKQKAAYFQFGWTAGRMPVPFGKREIVWFQSNKRTDTIYGRSPVQVLGDVLFTLLYGSSFSLDMFINNNIPAGIIQLLGANQPELDAFKQRFESKFIQKDVFSNQKKQWWNAPVSGSEVKWTPFNFSSAEMQVLESQFWYLKIAAACFGLTPSELGFTEDSNKAVDINQGAVFKRKALAPILRMMQQRINTQIMPEFRQEALEFAFDDFDHDEDKKKHDILEQELRMGVKTPEMVAVELDIDVDELKQGKEEERNLRMEEEAAKPNIMLGKDSPEKKNVREEEKEFDNVVEGFLDDEMVALDTLINQLPKDQLGKVDTKALSDEIIGKAMKLFSVGKLVLPLSKAITKAFNKGVEEVEKQFDRNILPSNQSAMAVEKMAFSNIEGATEEFKNKIKGIISRGVMNRRGAKSIAKEIKEQLDVTKTRATMIARTEMNAAFNEGSLKAAEDTGIPLDKVWDAHLDNRTSDVCNALDGQRVDIKDVFEYKGETFMRPPALPNCRSGLIFVEKDEEVIE